MSTSVITATSETDEIEENISDTSYDDSSCWEGITIFECIFCMTIFYKTNKLQRMALFSCITC